MSQVIKFEPNVPVVVALRYTDGREVDGQFGPQVMFSTSDDRRIFATPTLAEMIRATGVQPGEPIRIMKRVEGKTSRFEVTRVTAAVPAVRPAAATAVVPPHQAQPQQPPPRLSPAALAVAAAMGAAIDGLEEARAYAASSHGMTITWSAEDYRAVALTVLIQTWRSGAAPTPALTCAEATAPRANGGVH